MPVEVEFNSGIQEVINHSESNWTINGFELQPGSRMEFKEEMQWAANEQGDSLELAIKYIPLESTCNFRDLGGIQTKDGKQVAYGKIYRSDKLSELSEQDRSAMDDRSIFTVIDFRNELETSEEPDVLSENAKYVHLPIGDFDPKNFWSSLSEVKDNEQKADSLMLALYSTFPLNYTEEYKAFFNALLDSSNTDATVFHCTAGKDRTGLASALFYYSMGVDLETITKDYANSTYYRFDHNSKYIKLMKLKGIEPEVAQVIMGVKQEYMYEIFNTIENEYGTVDQYLTEALGVNDSARQMLRTKYLVN